MEQRNHPRRPGTDDFSRTRDHGPVRGRELLRRDDAVVADAGAGPLAERAADADSGQAPRGLPRLLVGDLYSSGLVWGRSGSVWWSLQGRRVCGGDPRCEQGLAAVKVWDQGRWRDLLTLRPIQRGQSSQWELEFADGYKIAPEFTSAEATARGTLLHGIYHDPRGRQHTITWRVQATATGVRVTMASTAAAAVSAKIWLAPGAVAEAAHSVTTSEPGVTTASGPATPVLLHWPAGTPASVSIREE